MSKTTQRLAVAAIISCTGFAATKFWYEKSKDDGYKIGNARKIASLVSMSNEVQKKPSSKIIWQPAFTNEDIYVGESIRTSKNSEAKIKLEASGVIIDLEPDSAIVLEEKSVDFVKGNIFVKSNNSGQDSGLILKSGDKNIALGKSEVTLGRDKSGGLDLQVLKGSVTGANLSAMNSNKITVIRPTPGDPIYLNTKENELVTFQWEVLPKGYTVQLEAGTNRDNLLVVSNATADGDKGELKASIKPGKLFYRLIARSQIASQKELRSSVLRTSVLAKIPPTPLSPEKDALVNLNRGDKKINFLWSNPTSFNEMIIEIATSKDLKQIYKKEVIKQDKLNNIILEIDKSGTYYWRVSGKLKSRNEYVSSAIQSFRANVLDSLSAPELISPKAEDRIPYESIKDKGLVLSWRPVVGAERYKISVFKLSENTSKTQQSKEVFFEAEGKQLQVAVKALKPGSYLWSTVAVGQKNENSKTSELRKFTVQTLPVIKWSDNKSEDEQFYITLKPTINLKWQSHDTAAKYTLKLDSEYLDKAITKVTSNTSVDDLPVPADGLYAAQVEAHDSRGQLIARSIERSVKIMSAPLLPAPVYAASLPSEIKASGSGSAKIEWVEVEGASQYILVIKDKNGTSEKEYQYAKVQAVLNSLMPGEYKIALRTVDKSGRKGPTGEERLIRVPAESTLNAPKFKGFKVK